MQVRIVVFAWLVTALVGGALWGLAHLKIQDQRHEHFKRRQASHQKQANAWSERWTKGLREGLDAIKEATPVKSLGRIVRESSYCDLVFELKQNRIVAPPLHPDKSLSSFDGSLTGAYQAFHERDHAQALENLEATLDQPGISRNAKAEGYMLQASALEQTGDLNRAQEACKQVLELFANEPAHPLALAALRRRLSLAQQDKEPRLCQTMAAQGLRRLRTALDFRAPSMLLETIRHLEILASPPEEPAKDDRDKTNPIESRAWLEAIDGEGAEWTSFATSEASCRTLQIESQIFLVCVRREEDRVFGTITSLDRIATSLPPGSQVFDRDQRPLLEKTTEANPGRPQLQASLGGVFAWDWTLPISDDWWHSRDAEARQTMALFGLIWLFISILIWMTTRTLKRQMELTHLKAEFVTNISHELKTPLTMIRMFSEMLSQGYSSRPDQTAKALGVIERESKRLDHLLENALTLSRESEGRLELSLERQDIAALIQENVDAFRPYLEQEGFRVACSIAPEIGPAQIDRDAFSQIFGNLVSNSVKYATERKEIDIRATREGRSLLIDVADRGVGLSRDEQTRIFQRFERGRRLSSSHPAGVGLGLSVVKSLMEQHDGSVEAISRDGGGTCFRLRLPAY